MLQSTELSDAYTLDKEVHAGTRGHVHLATRRSDGAGVVVKLYDRCRDAAATARREHEALCALADPRIPRSLELIADGEVPALVLERVGGISLAAWVRERSPALQDVLQVAAELAGILAVVHAARIIHRDVTPANVLIDPDTGAVRLIDFGIAIRLGAAERDRLGAPQQRGLAGTPAYLAPEQTGKIQHGCDFRADLYGLGATLYHALTGQPPFHGQSVDELLLAHIAREPLPPEQLCPSLPPPVCALLRKLLRKEPGERYQSARALQADLHELLRQLRERGAIADDFAIASHDAPERPRFPSQLYGREAEAARLHAAHERAALGQASAVLLCGPSGVGKSALLDALRPRLAERGTYLIQGKFSLYRELPYAGWVSALQSLAEQMLIESDARLARWREELRTGLGSIAQVLADWVPELGVVLGPGLPPVPPLGARETVVRLALALERFVRACATPEHPLVLVLDDVQWSDPGSRILLRSLLESEHSPGSLLLIATYRSEEVDAEHPLARMLATLATPAVQVEQLTLGPLDLAASTALLAAALGRSERDVRALASRIDRQTDSSPLLIRQSVEHLHAQGLLRYESGAWTWDERALAQATVPESAVALLAAKIDRLDSEAREVLQFASCMSDAFDARLLRDLGDFELARVQRALDALCEAGWIVPAKDGWRFAHDRLRETAQARLSAQARAHLHARTGQLLLARSDPDSCERRLLEIADHLNRGRELLPEALRLQLVALDVRAGRRSLGAGAATAASGYLAIARELFRESDWSEHRALGFDLYLQSAECSFLLGEFPAALQGLADLEARSPSEAERAEITVKQLHVRAFVESPEDCVRYGLHKLRELGLRWPLHPSWTRAWLSLLSVPLAWRVAGCSVDRPLPAERAIRPRALTALKVMGAFGGARSRFDARLSALALGFSMRQLARGVRAADPAWTVSNHALYWHVFSGGSRRTAQRTEQAIAWSERLPHPTWGPRTQVTIALLELWHGGRRRGIARLARIEPLAREVGDAEYAYYSRFLHLYFGILCGFAIDESRARLSELVKSVERWGYRFREPGQCEAAYAPLCGEPLEEDELERLFGPRVRAGAPRELFSATLGMMVLCVLGRHDLALALSEPDYTRMRTVAPHAHIADHTFYRGLAAAVLAGRQSGVPRRRSSAILRQSLRRLRGWARCSPDYQPMLELLQAEHARLRGRMAEAERAYEQAILAATRLGFSAHAALAAEQRARALAQARRSLDAAQSFSQAIELYHQWGARAKSRALERERRSLLGAIRRPRRKTSEPEED